MIQIKQQPWTEMVAHAQQIYPNECVGVMLGSSKNGTKTVTEALRMENVHDGGVG
jgi:proteasome lid subunit RPN8/RPN11